MIRPAGRNSAFPRPLPVRHTPRQRPRLGSVILTAVAGVPDPCVQGCPVLCTAKGGRLHEPPCPFIRQPAEDVAWAAFLGAPTPTAALLFFPFRRFLGQQLRSCALVLRGKNPTAERLEPLH